MTSDARRALRTIERSVSAVAVLVIVAMIAGYLRADAEALRTICLALIAVNLLREFMIGSENVAARLGFNVSKEGASATLDSKDAEGDGTEPKQ